MEELTTNLSNISLENIPTESADSDSFKLPVPESYTSNNPKEQILLKFSENFQRQFRQLYSDRKPLLLTPTNEHGVPKFICSTVRPTYLKYDELYEYDGCSSFVADYLTYEPLKIPNEMPSTVVSPTMVLNEQQGNCFDYAILLASLLIGVGYDAYCVCGYASQDVCLLNLGRHTCPLLQEKEEVKEEKEEEKMNRYKVRPLRDFSSAFEKRMIAKEKAKIEEERLQHEKEEAAKIAEAEAPPPDKYHGLRIHCWVLVLMGKRDVGEDYFIEPTTGETHPLDWDQYHGIETLWNHKNYWVNMQDCSEGVKDLSYDLGDAAKWEFFFPNVDRPLLVIPGEDIKREESEEQVSRDTKEVFQLPPSWVLPFDVTPRDIETRCPKGKKTILYYRSKLEKFAEYLNQDGLVTRLTAYSDTARASKTELKCFFKHREDLLETRVEKAKSGEIQESFSSGRERSLKIHTHYDSNPLRLGHRTFEFYSHARVDGLAKREMTRTEMVEHYVDRADFLYYRHVTYEKIPKKHMVLEGQDNSRKIIKVVDKFHPNPALPPNNDVAERTLILSDNQIKITYQLEEGRNTASVTEFVVPPMNPEQAVLLTYDPEGISSYQVDPYVKEPKNRFLFEQLESLVQARDDTIIQIRQSEKETENILNARAHEELHTSLSISVYDVVRNETARKHRQEQERRLAEEEQIRKEKERDYLAPFLARIGDPVELTVEEKERVAQDCLHDLRARLVDKANIIQGRFEQETENLQGRQDWYKTNQGTLTKEEERDYTTFCKDKMFTIHILEERLKRLKENAPQTYLNLERRLAQDSRVIYYPFSSR